MGLFTEGPSIDELMAKRNQRSSALQQSLATQAGQGARDPMQAQAASLLGSSLGRALAGSMDGGDYRSKLEAKEAEKLGIQQQYLTAAGADSSAAMYDMVKILKKDNPLAAMKMLELAKAKKREEQAATTAAAAAAAEKVEILRKEAAEVTENIRAEGVEETAAGVLADAKVTGDVVKQVTGAELKLLNPELDIPDGTLFNQTAGGKLTQLGGKGQTINIENMGAIPKDYVLKKDAEDNPYYEVIKGSPTDKAEKLALEKEENKDESAAVTNSAVLQGAKNLRAFLETDRDSSTTFVTGLGGALSGSLPIATVRKEAEAALDEMGSNTGFAMLQTMRDNSQTGGALGNVTVREIELLQSQIGKLDLDMGPEALLEKVTQYEARFKRLMVIASKGLSAEDKAALDAEWEASEQGQLVANALTPKAVTPAGGTSVRGPAGQQPQLSAAALKFSK